MLTRLRKPLSRPVAARVESLSSAYSKNQSHQIPIRVFSHEQSRRNEKQQLRFGSHHGQTFEESISSSSSTLYFAALIGATIGGLSLAYCLDKKVTFFSVFFPVPTSFMSRVLKTPNGKQWEPASQKSLRVIQNMMTDHMAHSSSDSLGTLLELTTQKTALVAPMVQPWGFFSFLDFHSTFFFSHFLFPSSRYPPESKWGANVGLDIARQVLEPVKKKYPDVSYADLWTLAGAVSLVRVSDCSLDPIVTPYST